MIILIKVAWVPVQAFAFGGSASPSAHLDLHSTKKPFSRNKKSIWAIISRVLWRSRQSLLCGFAGFALFWFRSYSFWRTGEETPQACSGYTLQKGGVQMRGLFGVLSPQQLPVNWGVFEGPQTGLAPFIDPDVTCMSGSCLGLYCLRYLIWYSSAGFSFVFIKMATAFRNFRSSWQGHFATAVLHFCEVSPTVSQGRGHA